MGEGIGAMNRNQYRGLARKYRKYSLELQSDAQRVQRTTHPPCERSEAIKEAAGRLDAVAQDIENEFG